MRSCRARPGQPREGASPPARQSRCWPRHARAPHRLGTRRSLCRKRLAAQCRFPAVRGHDWQRFRSQPAGPSLPKGLPEPDRVRGSATNPRPNPPERPPPAPAADDKTRFRLPRPRQRALRPQARRRRLARRPRQALPFPARHPEARSLRPSERHHKSQRLRRFRLRASPPAPVHIAARARQQEHRLHGSRRGVNNPRLYRRVAEPVRPARCFPQAAPVRRPLPEQPLPRTERFLRRGRLVLLRLRMALLPVQGEPARPYGRPPSHRRSLPVETQPALRPDQRLLPAPAPRRPRSKAPRIPPAALPRPAQKRLLPSPHLQLRAWKSQASRRAAAKHPHVPLRLHG